MRTHFAGFLLLALCVCDAAKPKSIHVATRPTWNETSLIVEASEFFHDQSVEQYWKFVDGLLSELSTTKEDVADDKSEFDLALKIAAAISGPAVQNVLKYSLAIRFYSPKAELYRQLFNEAVTEAVVADANLAACPAILSLQGNLLCATDASAPAKIAALVAAGGDRGPMPESFDHSVRGTGGAAAVVLYARFTSAAFPAAHAQATTLAKEHGLQYVLRPLVPASAQPMSLQGFGAELRIKSMEYKVLDDTKIEINDDDAPSISELLGESADAVDVSGFYFDKLTQRRPELAESLASFRNELTAASAAEDDKIKVWDMKDLGTQASQSILKSKDPLLLLRDISQNFPMYASGLTKLRVNKQVQRGIKKRSKGFPVPPGDSMLVINDMEMSIDTLDAFKLHEILKGEAAINDVITELHLPAAVTAKLMQVQLPGDDEGGGALPTKSAFRVNMDVTGSSTQEVVTWINDIQEDSQYKSWGRSVTELLAPGWPNQLRYVKKNLYTGVLVLNPATATGLQALSRMRFFIEKNAPFRGGFAFVIPASTAEQAADTWDAELLPGEDWAALAARRPSTAPEASTTTAEDKPDHDYDISPAALVSKLFHWLEDDDSMETALGFLELLADQERDLTHRDEVKELFKKFMKKIGRGKTAMATYKTIALSDEHEEFVIKSKQYLGARGFVNADDPVFVCNGVSYPLAAANFREVLMESLGGEQEYLTMLVQQGAVTDHTNIPQYFEKLPLSFARQNSHNVLSAVKAMSFLGALPDYSALPYLFSPGDEFLVKAATHWVVGDLSSAQGLRLASAAVEHLYHGDDAYNCRVGLLHNPAQGSGHALANFLAQLTAKTSTTKALPVIRQALALASYLRGSPGLLQEALGQLADSSRAVKDKHKAALKAAVARDSFEAAVDVSALGLAPGASAIVTNGRVVAIPAGATQAELQADFALLDQVVYSFTGGAETVALLQDVAFEGLDPDAITASFIDGVVMRMCFALAKRAAGAPGSASAVVWPDLSDDVATLRYEVPGALLKVVAVLDPLSKDAQRLAPFLVAMRDGLACDITVVLNPPKTVSSFPLQRFYRYAISTSPAFDAAGAVRPAAGVIFANLATESLLTLTMETPESWRVAADVCAHDMDNIRLSDIQQESLQAVFKLKNLLLFGNCHEAQRDPPAGLQLDLAGQGVVADTLVMQNLGYFQLQANPGPWSLSLHGAANTVYKIENGVVRSGEEFESSRVFVSSFDEGSRSLAVSRRPGQGSTKLESLTMEMAPAKPAQRGFLSSLFQSKPAPASGNETIHIFSVASGHLYERFLKIMMLSVIRNTESPVKFWFIENFFSPQFKDFVPKMAQEYGYEVEFVSYKWPLWLRRQEEKQRVIWGYKILFLDVLFPLDIKRIIYIDADQVVRGDVKELAEMNLRGAPYAYTPFCNRKDNSNPDTEGFRFWKQGYWKDHLRGKPYHISALYVVDLVQFRKMRAGDSLRMIYDNLSQDPNSLANLDQDLPNYAQNMVPIHSLPQSWLWCQAWCSMDSLETAKTIDLCNNPLTKRPKLEVAKELLPEWETLDQEAALLTAKVTASNKHDHDEL